MKPAWMRIGSAAVLGLAFSLSPALLSAGGKAKALAPAPLTATALSVEVDGDSTLHRWKATALTATVTAVVAPSAKGLMDSLAHGGLKSLELVAQTASLSSPEGKSMNTAMRKDLDALDYPTLRFSLKSYHLEGMNVTAQGDLSIHGVTHAVTLKAALQDGPHGVVVSGVQPVLMVDYGITVPVMMFGTIRVADLVNVHYSFELPH